MSSMTLELFSALQEAGVKQESARRVADAMDEAIDKRYAIHARELATRGDIETVRKEVEIVRKEIETSRREMADALRTQINWLTGLIVGASALIVGLIKFL